MSQVIHDRYGAPHGKDCLSDLSLINPETDCELYEEKLEQMTALEGRLERRVETYVREGKASRVAIFSRDLLTRRFVGIHDTEQFLMASLLKVPLAIAYYRYAETDAQLLSQKIVYDGSVNLYQEQTIEPAEKLTPHTEYPVKDLIYRSLVYSDNTATQLLSQRILPGYFDGVLTALGISKIDQHTLEDAVSARVYANMFRSLYAASFLTRQSSNEILDILTRGAYQDGVRSVLPTHVRVASKFGERIILNGDTDEVLMRQLHECGIVYAANGDEPYSFCILTEGKDFENLQNIIQEISRELYESLAQ